MRILLVSSDGWKAVIKWAELFATMPRGEALNAVKGCNECHGLRAEGTSPEGKRPAPGLMGHGAAT